MTRVRCVAIRSLSAITLVCAFVFPAASALSTRELRIENFQSETIVLSDGTIDVTESIQAHFICGPCPRVICEAPLRLRAATRIVETAAPSFLMAREQVRPLR